MSAAWWLQQQRERMLREEMERREHWDRYGSPFDGRGGYYPRPSPYPNGRVPTLGELARRRKP